jgi:hypothetical protein
VDVREEGGTIDVAVLTTTHNVNLSRKNSVGQSYYSSLTHSIPSSSGCAKTSSRNVFAIANHGASGSLLMKQDFALLSVFVTVLQRFWSVKWSLGVEALKA